MINYALIMAAGRGERMRPLTDTIPKPMAPFLSESLLSYGLNNLKPQVKNIFVTVGYKASKLAAHAIDHGANGILNTSGKGNAWWLTNSILKDINENILVLTADNLCRTTFKVYFEEAERKSINSCMIIGVNPIQGIDGDYIHTFKHKPDIIRLLSRKSVSPKYASGIQLINPYQTNTMLKNGASNIEDFKDVWASLIKVNQLYLSESSPKRWFSVDTMLQLQWGEEYMAQFT